MDPETNTASFTLTLSGAENAPEIETYTPSGPMDPRCIVCTWITWRPVFGGKFTAEIRAVVFLNDGTDADLRRAQGYVASAESGQVFQFRTDDLNPLGSARALVLRDLARRDDLMREIAQYSNVSPSDD